MLRLGSAVTRRVFRPSSNIPGFTTVASSNVDDLKLTIREMVHDKSTAKWTHIDKVNENQKVFNICFRTVPQTDNGIAHILGECNIL
jgi:Zn-dependent M16 (insulinase) family peptidase